MFDPWCPTCAARTLLSARRLLRLEATPRGHRAHLRCWCGTVVTMEVARAATDRAPAPARTPDVAA